MLDTLTKPSTQLKALKLVPEGASIKKSDIPFNGTFILRNKVNSFFDRSQKQFLEVPLYEPIAKVNFIDRIRIRRFNASKGNSGNNRVWPQEITATLIR